MAPKGTYMLDDTGERESLLKNSISQIFQCRFLTVVDDAVFQ